MNSAPARGQRNAADPKEVKRTGRKVRDRREDELDDLRDTLRTEQGRRVLWRLLSQCRVFESVYEDSPRIGYNAGRQDMGHYLMAEIDAADGEGIFLMMREARQRARKDDLDTLAAQTPSATEGTDGH